MEISKKEAIRVVAQSGNRCAFQGCTQRLVCSEQFNIGELAHIIARSPDGPRGIAKDVPATELHHHTNLIILLCRNHHAVIDQNAEEYTVDRLRAMKQEHEQDVARRMGATPSWIEATTDLSEFLTDQSEHAYWSPTLCTESDVLYGTPPSDAIIRYQIPPQMIPRLCKLATRVLEAMKLAGLRTNLGSTDSPTDTVYTEVRRFNATAEKALLRHRPGFVWLPHAPSQYEKMFLEGFESHLCSI